MGATPNPFRGTTEIRFAVPANENVRLHIYNASGQLVSTLVDGPMTAGDHTVTFRGQNLPSGIYFTALRVDGCLVTRSVVLSR
jgi:flagellar hook assembly protein FlgD